MDICVGDVPSVPSQHWLLVAELPANTGLVSIVVKRWQAIQY